MKIYRIVPVNDRTGELLWATNYWTTAETAWEDGEQNDPRMDKYIPLN